MRDQFITACILLCFFIGCATKSPVVKKSQSKISNSESSQMSETSNLDVQLSNLTQQIINSLTETRKSKIAVIEFSDIKGNVTDFGRYVSEELITRLFLTKKFEVIERQLLNKVMEEHKLTTTGLIDENSAKQLGKILGVDAIASGSITDLGESLKINARLISTETGQIFSVAAVEVVKDKKVEKLLTVITQTKNTQQPDSDVNSLSSGQPGLKGEYYNLPPFSGSPTIPTGNPTFTRVDPTISFEWGYNSPAPKISADYFYIRWSGNIYIETTGSYVFCVGDHDRGFGRNFCGFTDLGVRLSVNNRALIERWVESTDRSSITIFLQGNQWYPIQLEVFDQSEDAQCYLFWQPPGESDVSIVPSTVLRSE